MSENIKGLADPEVTNSYDKILRKEKRLTWIVTYAIPIPMFILLEIAFFTNKQLVSVVLIISVLIYVLVTTIGFQPIPRKKYGPRNPVHSASVFFERTGYDKMYIRWEVWSKLQSQYIQLIIFVIAWVAIMMSVLSLAKTHTAEINTMNDFLATLLIVPSIMVLNSLMFKVSLTQYRDFGRCCSIGCFLIVTKFQSLDELKKTVYMIDGLKHYDYYIRKNLKLRINNLETFFSQIIGDSKESVNNLPETILVKLEKGEELDLLRFLIARSGISEDKPMLVSEKFSTKLEKWYQLIIPVVAVMVAIIQLVR